MLSTLYRAATDLGSPLISLYLRRRLAAGREDGERFAERFGHPSRPRPDGRLIWCHAASVGEAVSLLLLIEKIHALYPKTHFLLTTGTVTAARMMVSRLPSYAIHQYVPVDRMPYVARFLDHCIPMPRSGSNPNYGRIFYRVCVTRHSRRFAECAHVGKIISPLASGQGVCPKLAVYFLAVSGANRKRPRTF